ncbi:MAG: AAA family ATPase [bacterium]|nr:AAA family ATPase [bacterium]
MLQSSDGNAYFYDVAYENYSCIKAICKTIEKEGYYKQPEELLKQTIYETLDVYIEAVLTDFCIACTRFDLENRRFIKSLFSTFHILECEEDEITEKEIISIHHIVMAPPILLQLCGLYDDEHSKEISSLFLDRMLSILLALASLNEHKDRHALFYIQEYYERLIKYVHTSQRIRRFSKRYIFNKICSDTILKLEEMNFVINTEYRKIEHRNTETIQETTNITKTELEVEKATLIDQKPQLNVSLEELNSLVGLKKVKEQITSLINLIKVRKLREKYGMPLTNLSYHMVFSGNPGTGKTTVARLVANIYRELGIVKKGTFVEKDRSGLVAGYVGQTAIKVTEVVKTALGGVLFIDEAYSLTNSKLPNDFGNEALETLVKLMEDYRDDLVVIVAGYKEEMQDFLKSNTGLISRFNTFIEFEDYSCDELLQILNTFAEKNQMKFSEEAINQMRKQFILDNVVHSRNFGNARGVRNVFERILVNQANRLVYNHMVSKEAVSTIEVEDVVGETLA